MAFQRIAILSIGEMGYHWARILTSRGIEVLTYAKDRSETTRKRAETIGVKCLPSMNRLVRDADLIVSMWSRLRQSAWLRRSPRQPQSWVERIFSISTRMAFLR